MVLEVTQNTGMRMSSHFIKVKKGPLVECLTCPLCYKLLREATTICECLHTFCRECIYQKLVDEETFCCPICNVYLGCVPMEKLRPDNNLQDVRVKIFPLKKRKMKASETIPIISVPARRKERSLSSLVISTPPVSTQGGFSSRTKAVARKAAASRGTVSKINGGREVDVAQDHLERLSSIERPAKTFILSKRQRTSGGETSNPMADEDVQNIAAPEVSGQRTGKGASWERLACLAEAANRTETSQLPSTSLAAVKTEEPDKYRSTKDANVMKKRSGSSISSARKKELAKVHTGPNARVTLKSRATGSERLSISRKQRSAAGALENGSSIKCERRISPVWFALLASKNQVGDNALPQIPKCYLRIKDGNVPVSYVKKYLVKKLNLKSESEVEITCCGQPIVPSLALYSLVEFWLQYAAASDRLTSIQDEDAEKADSKTHSATGNPSAEEFMMVLRYGRKSARG